MNIFDIAVVIILLFCMFGAYNRGLIVTLFKLCSGILALLLTNYVYPILSKFLRESTSIFSFLKELVVDRMGLDEFVNAETLKAKTDLIQSLEIPEFLTKSLLANNNSEVYKVLNVSSIEDYVAGYIANIILNTISMILVFMVVSALMSLIVKSLRIVSKLPIISTFNKIGGLALGFLQGTLFIWIAFAFMTFFLYKPENMKIFQELNDSILAIKFYETNIILDMIMKIVT